MSYVPSPAELNLEWSTLVRWKMEDNNDGIVGAVRTLSNRPSVRYRPRSVRVVSEQIIVQGHYDYGLDAALSYFESFQRESDPRTALLFLSREVTIRGPSVESGYAMLSWETADQQRP